MLRSNLPKLVIKFFKTDWSILSSDIQESRIAFELVHNFYLDLILTLSGGQYEENEEDEENYEEYYEENEEDEEHYEEMEDIGNDPNSHIINILDLMSDVSFLIIKDAYGDMYDRLCEYFNMTCSVLLYNWKVLTQPYKYDEQVCDIVKMASKYPDIKEQAKKIQQHFEILKTEGATRKQLSGIEIFIKPFLLDECTEHTRNRLRRYIKPDDLSSNSNLPNLVSKFYKTDWSFVLLDIQKSREIFNSVTSLFNDVSTAIYAENEEHLDSDEETDNDPLVHMMHMLGMMSYVSS
ncbi:hypothetical protein HZS_5525, partial [Henneguya salminicola]